MQFIFQIVEVCVLSLKHRSLCTIIEANELYILRLEYPNYFIVSPTCFDWSGLLWRSL